MPRILRIINRLNLGGPTYNAAYLSKHLAPEFETLLVSGIKQDSEESSEYIVDQMGLNAFFIPEMKREIDFKNDRIAYKKIKELIAEFKPDIVHTHAAKAGTLGRLAAYHMNVPVVLHTFHGHVFHSYFNPIKTKLFIGIEKYLAKKSSRIITISEAQKKEICSIFKVCAEEKAEVIPLGFDLSRFQQNIKEKRARFRKKYFLKEDEIAIGIIGRLVPVKNHSLFLKGINRILQTTDKKIKVLIIGDGEERANIEQMARELNIPFADQPGSNAPLLFTSWIKEIDEAISGLDIIAMTAFNEGTPVSLIEAQAGNKPIVSTNVGGIEDVVLPGRTALLSESDDVAAFANNLITLIQDDNLRTAMSQAGWEHVKNKFHYTRLVKDMRTLYCELLGIKTG